MFSDTQHSPTTTKANSRWINWLIKISLVLVFCVVMFYQISREQQLASLWTSFVSTLSYQKAWYLVGALLLMPVNWSIESIKWGSLVRKYEAISFKTSFYAIMSGLTLGILTPGRIGEYGGRVLFVEAENNWKAVITTFVTSMSQHVVNLTFGACCAILFVYFNFGISQLLLIGSLFFVFSMSLVAYALYFHIDTLKKFFKRVKIPYLSKAIGKHSEVLKLFTKTDLFKISAWSLFRYIVYSTQYVLLLYFFGIEASYITLFLGVSTIFLIQSSLPLPPMVSVFARGEIALIIWGLFSANEIAILSSSFGLWIINLLIPAFFGLLLSMDKDVVKSFGYEK